MVFDVVKLRAQAALRNPQRQGKVIFQIAHLRSVAEPIPYLREYSSAAFLTIAAVPLSVAAIALDFVLDRCDRVRPSAVCC